MTDGHHIYLVNPVIAVLFESNADTIKHLVIIFDPTFFPLTYFAFVCRFTVILL